MGPAVTDAAAWYDSADWVGISATPYATLTIQALLEPGRTDLNRVLIDYPVPMKDQSTVVLKAINWPKAFVVKGLRPVAEGENARAKCLTLLTEHGVPKGTESKHFNSMVFFDYCIGLWNKQVKQRRDRRAKRQLDPTAPGIAGAAA